MQSCEVGAIYRKQSSNCHFLLLLIDVGILFERDEQERIWDAGELDVLPKWTGPEELHVEPQLRKYLRGILGLSYIYFFHKGGALLDDGEIVHPQQRQLLAVLSDIGGSMVFVADELLSERTEHSFPLLQQRTDGLESRLTLLQQVYLVGEQIHLQLVVLLRSFACALRGGTENQLRVAD